MAKLTLSMGDSDIRAAKRLAKRDGLSVSAWIRSIVRARSRAKKKLSDLPPLTRSMVGVISVPKGKTDRQLIEEALAEKYGL